jgi:uncharacterized protein YwlG (UPF0340 family)
MQESIKRIGDKWVVYPKKGGSRLGTHSSKEKAQKQLSAIEISKKERGVKEYIKQRMVDVKDKRLFLERLLEKCKCKN